MTNDESLFATAPLSRRELEDQEADAIGITLVEVLGLRKNKDGKYNTSWGDKTTIGLAKTVKRIIEGG